MKIFEIIYRKCDSAHFAGLKGYCKMERVKIEAPNKNEAILYAILQIKDGLSYVLDYEFFEIKNAFIKAQTRDEIYYFDSFEIFK